jgi:molybdate transport system permease protein
MPGKDQGALTLVFVSIVISVTALLLSEWLARRVQKRMHGQ